MLLAVDLSNTNITLGCVIGGEISGVMRMETRRSCPDLEYAALIAQMLHITGVKRSDFTGAILSSVVPPLTETLVSALRLVTGHEPIVVGAGVKTGINIGINDPSQLGADLVCGAVGALSSWTPPFIVISVDTATTLTVVDGKGRIIGGAIMPGPGVSMNALTAGASLLPHVPLEAPKKVIGGNTIECMKSGAVLGAASAIDGMADRVEEELGESAALIATGPLAPRIIPHCRREIEMDENLTIKGLAQIWRRNQK